MCRVIDTIHASKKNSNNFQKLLEEWKTYLIQNLMVSKNDPKLKFINNKYMLIFLLNIVCPDIEIKEISCYHFVFTFFTNILTSNDEDLMVGELFVHLNLKQIFFISSIFYILSFILFVDVIGHMIEKNDIKEIEKSGNKKIIEIMLHDL